MVFFLIIGVLLGIFVTQEYENNVPKLKPLFLEASKILQKMIKGEDQNVERQKTF